MVWWPGAGEPVLRYVPPEAWPGWLLAELAPPPALTSPRRGFEHFEHFEQRTEPPGRPHAAADPRPRPGARRGVARRDH